MGLFSKKDKSASDAASDADRNALFGSKKGSPAPSSANPYAQPPGGAAPPPYSGGGLSDRARAEKSPVPPGGYGAGGAAYGGSGAYGQDRYGGGAGAGGGTTSRYGAGGYGGMGDSDAGRQELFGNAAQRAQQQPAGPGGPYSSTVGGANNAAYGSYADRQLTQEEEEEEDVAAAKQQIRFSELPPPFPRWFERRRRCSGWIAGLEETLPVLTV